MSARARLLLLAALLAAASPALPAEYLSVADSPAILYDSPSVKGKKLFAASRHLPLEVVVSVEGWVKVRDSSGGLAWAEKRALSNKRYVVVTANLAAMRQAPEENAATLAQIRKQVALEWLESTGTGWIKARHPDGVTGYLKVSEVWGG
jgi:SH3-like domain-containing protein